jgi:hypothetical protein
LNDDRSTGGLRDSAGRHVTRQRNPADSLRARHCRSLGTQIAPLVKEHDAVFVVDYLCFEAELDGGLLASAEFIVCYGVRGPLAALDDRAHLETPAGLIRTLRVLIPSIAVPAFLSAIAVAILDGTEAGLILRWADMLALLI